MVKRVISFVFGYFPWTKLCRAHHSFSFFLSLSLYLLAKINLIYGFYSNKCMFNLPRTSY
jgi:hypothetical protein